MIKLNKLCDFRSEGEGLNLGFLRLFRLMMILNSYTCLKIFERTYFWLGLVVLVVLIRGLCLDLTRTTDTSHQQIITRGSWKTLNVSYHAENVTRFVKVRPPRFGEVMEIMLRVLQNSEFYNQLNAKIITGDARSEIRLEYPEFNTSEPMFVDPNDLAIFHVASDNRKFLGRHKPIGVVALMKNGTADPDLDCGAYTDLAAFQGRPSRGSAVSSRIEGVVCPLLIPDGGFFQHFLDGVLPKIVQIYELVREIRVKLLVNRIRNRSVLDMFRQLDVPEDSLIFSEGGAVVTDVQLNTCKTPPIHPILWQRARQMLVPRPMTSSSRYVVFVVRTRTRNGGRRIVNRRQIESFLKRRYGERFRSFSGDLTFAASRDLFSRASVVIGCHGGGMYNVHFSQSGTDIVELMPITDAQTPPSGLSHTVIWRVSGALAQRYWRIHSRSLNRKNDVLLPLDKLKAVLDKIDSTRNSD